MAGRSIKWKPFISFEFFEPSEVLLITDGEGIEVYEFCVDSGCWVSVNDEAFEKVNLNKDCYYIDQELLIAGLREI